MKMFQKSSTLLVCLLVWTAVLPGAPAVHLKRRLLQTTDDLGAFRVGPLKRRHFGSSHYLLQFSERPSAGQLAELRGRGVRVTSYVPDSALVVAAADGTAWEDLGLKYVGRLDELDKLSSELASGEESNYVVVEFHPDVDMTDARALIHERSLRVDERQNLLNHQLLVDGETENIMRLAEWDEVAYVYPASQALIDGEVTIACAGAITELGPIAQYVKIGPAWPRTGAAGTPVTLGYVIGQLTSKLPAAATKTEIERALNEWAKSGNLQFNAGDNASAPRTISIFFASGAHGDPYPFDGPGSVLAHTFYPPPNSEPIAGDMHLDADEAWHIGSSIDLFSVVLHEAGHALGLAHSDKPSAVMYPFYKTVSGLNADDMAGIQDLYGPAQQSPAPTPTPTPIPALLLTILSPIPNGATSAAAAAIAGTATGGSGALRITWVNDRGGAGVASGSANWTIAAVALSTGANRVSITVTDAVNKTASQTIQITRAASTDTAAPTLLIASPAAALIYTSASSLTLSGAAADNVGVTSVRWSNTFGASGPAAGTNNWRIESVPLLVGTNKITVKAFDAAGNYGSRMIMVVRR